MDGHASEGIVTTCRSCHQPIVFAWTTKGKKLPLDPEPSPAGTVRLDRTTAYVLSAADTVTLRAADQALHTSHISTCPDAGAWRNR